MTNFTDTENYNLLLWEKFTSTQQAIILSLKIFWREKTYGKNKSVFPSREKLGQMSKYSESTVKRLICSENFKLIAEKKVRRKTNGRNSSNEYVLNDFFFDFVEKLDDLGLAKNYEKHREWLNLEIQKHEGFLMQKWLNKQKLSTIDDPRTSPRGRPAIKTSSYPDALKYSTKTESAINKCSRNKEALLREEKLLPSTVIWLRNNLLPHLAIAVKQDLDWFGRHKMRSIDGYIVDSVKRNSRKYFGEKI